MHFNPRIFIPFFFLWLAGCSFQPSEMKIAEQVMETAPDSALHLLQSMHIDHSMSSADRALYGLLYFQALDNNKLPLKPDSLINFSLNYYQKENDIKRLPYCYYYKAVIFKNAQHYDESTIFYLKALDQLKFNKDDVLFGKIYAAMGDICSVQKDYEEALRKYHLSVNYYNQAGKPIEASYRILDIGRTYRLIKNYKAAHRYYIQALTQTSDSIFRGAALQEIGINYYWAKQFDSAQYYLQQSLLFPYKSTNFSIRCYTLADLYFDIAQYDSAFYYASKALNYPTNFFTQRDCYRILANTENKKGNFKQMAYYMVQYQAFSDSVRKIESQTKTTILEDIHQTTEAAGKTKQYLTILGWILPFLVTISIFILLRLRKRNKGNEEQLEQVELQLSEKQSLLRNSLMQKIEETKTLQANLRKKASPAEREMMDKELYNICLHVNDWGKFNNLMNHTFNNLISKLERNYPDITHKEIIWCCLFLLDISTPEVLLLLEYKQDSLYKLKQRLVQKMNLKNAKELDSLLEDLVTGK
jgi:tetratricopeptide (TPR) repeat protein